LLGQSIEFVFTDADEFVVVNPAYRYPFDDDIFFEKGMEYLLL